MNGRAFVGCMICLLWLGAGWVHVMSREAVQAVDGEVARSVIMEHDVALARMQQQAQQAYELIQQDECDESSCMNTLRNIIARLITSSQQVRYAEVTSLEGMHEVTEVLMETMRQLTAVTPDASRIRKQIAQVRIVVDALQPHVDERLWRTLGERLLQDAQKWKQEGYAIRIWERWYAGYRFVRPAIVVDQGDATVYAWDAAMRRLQQLVIRRQWAAMSEPWRIAMEEQQRIFSSKKEDYTPTMGWMLSPPALQKTILFFIFMMLISFGYVGWRRYRGTRGIVRVKRTSSVPPDDAAHENEPSEQWPHAPVR